jgi:hypothetical protein
LKTLRSRGHRALQAILIQFRMQTTPTPKETAARPERHRQQLGLTQRELAARLKRPQSYVWKIENGERSIDPVECAAWARGCGKTPMALFLEFAEALDRRV